MNVERDEHHLYPDKKQDADEAVSQMLESVEYIGQHKIERTQPQNGKNIGRKHQKRVGCDREYRRHGIEREQYIGGLDNHQRHKQGSHCAAAILKSGEKIPAIVTVAHGIEFLDEPHHCSIIEVIIAVIMLPHFPSRVEQQCPENVKQPSEVVYQRNAEPDQNAPENKHAQNAPKKDTVLMLFWHPKLREHQRHHEQVVNAQRFFQQVACKIFERSLMPAHWLVRIVAKIPPMVFVGIKYKNVEGQCQPNPNKCIEKCLFCTWRMALFIENTKVNRHENKHKGDESNPDYWVYHIKRELGAVWRILAICLVRRRKVQRL